MIATLDNALPTLPVKWLMGLFVLCFLALCLYSLPAKILGGYLKDYGVHCRGISGSVWDAQFSSVTFANQHWPEMKLSLSGLSILLGNLEAALDIRNDQSELSTVISEYENGYVALGPLIGATSLNIMQNGQIYPSRISIDADQVVVDQNGICRSGDFNIRTDFLNLFLSKLADDIPVLSGSADCMDGRITISMQTEKNGIEIMFAGEVSDNRQDGIITLMLPEKLEQNQTVIGELNASGFKKNGTIWEATMEIGV